MYRAFSDPLMTTPSAQIATDPLVRVEVRASRLRNWLAEGLVGAGELRCLDHDSKSCVRALCLENVRQALAGDGLDDICAQCGACSKP